ncbi:hypothetical protein [Vibrio sp. Hal054]|uniref:hypothetical protein n=1 Tax=Vibrio sp. Hal054 TaxID=3035158 RepID=UPI00301DC2F0
MEFRTAHDNITLSTVQGIVLAQSSSDNTHMAATFVGNGFAGGTQVSTKTINHRQVWIRASDGREVCFDFINSDLNFHVGHDLKVLVGVVGSSGYQFVVGAKNVTTGQVASLWEVSQYPSHSQFNKPWLGLLSLVVIGGVSGQLVTWAVNKIDIAIPYAEVVSLCGYVVPVCLALLLNLNLYRKATHCKTFLRNAVVSI